MSDDNAVGQRTPISEWCAEVKRRLAALERDVGALRRAEALGELARIDAEEVGR